MLTAADLDPRLILPAPPAKNSIQARAELSELHAVELARTQADLTSARFDSETTNASIFAEILGPAFDLAKLPATNRLFAIVRVTEKDVADRGKAEFLRERPWIVDASLKTCERSDKPLSSYPSGHTTMAFSMGSVLAQLVPDKAAAVLGRAARYGQSRVVCEQHYRSDVTAGEALGVLVAERLMAKPAFRDAFANAKAELESVGIARAAH
ncbi:MAG: phosphatase PAP2 family protein [Sphingomonadales bacterium]